MLAAAIGIDRAVEGDVGRIVPRDDAAGAVARVDGVEPGRHGIGAAPAVVEGDALLGLEAAARVAGGAAALAWVGRGFLIHGSSVATAREQSKNYRIAKLRGKLRATGEA
jgi:hypothetical protein